MIYSHSWVEEGAGLLSTGRYQPVHLWDTTTGELQVNQEPKQSIIRSLGLEPNNPQSVHLDIRYR